MFKKLISLILALGLALTGCSPKNELQGLGPGKNLLETEKSILEAIYKKKDIKDLEKAYDICSITGAYKDFESAAYYLSVLEKYRNPKDQLKIDEMILDLGLNLGVKDSVFYNLSSLYKTNKSPELLKKTLGLANKKGYEDLDPDFAHNIYRELIEKGASLEDKIDFLKLLRNSQYTDDLDIADSVPKLVYHGLNSKEKASEDLQKAFADYYSKIMDEENAAFVQEEAVKNKVNESIFVNQNYMARAKDRDIKLLDTEKINSEIYKGDLQVSLFETDSGLQLALFNREEFLDFSHITNDSYLDNAYIDIFEEGDYPIAVNYSRDKEFFVTFFKIEGNKLLALDQIKTSHDLEGELLDKFEYRVGSKALSSYYLARISETDDYIYHTTGYNDIFPTGVELIQGGYYDLDSVSNKENNSLKFIHKGYQSFNNTLREELAVVTEDGNYQISNGFVDYKYKNKNWQPIRFFLATRERGNDISFYHRDYKSRSYLDNPNHDIDENGKGYYKDVDMRTIMEEINPNNQPKTWGTSLSKEEKVFFKDPNLERLVKESLGILDRDVYPKDMKELIEIESSYPKIDNLNLITDLTGLEYAINLEKLYLWRDAVEDLEPISRLGKLKYINLSSNNVKDVSPLRNLKKLEVLILDRNKILDPSPLAGLENLETINLSFNNDMRNLKSILNLKDLNPFFEQEGLKEEKVDWNK